MILFLWLLSGIFPTPTVEATSQNLYVTEFDVPTPTSGPLGIATDDRGFVWFTETNASKVGRFDPTTRQFAEYLIPGEVTDLSGIAVDQSGIVWLTEFSNQTKQGSLGRLDPEKGSYEKYIIPRSRSAPMQIQVDPRGSVWFADLAGNSITRFDPELKAFRDFTLPSNNSGPAGLTMDSQGNVWFTEAYKSRIGVLFAVNSTIREFLPPFQVFSPVGIAVDKNRLIWFADHGGNWIIRFDPAQKVFERFYTSKPPPEVYPVSIPNDLIIDPQGRVWIAEHGGNKIGAFLPSEMKWVEYHVPTGPVAVVLWLALDQLGRVWFNEYAANKIGYVDPSIPLPFNVVVTPATTSVSRLSTASYHLQLETNTSGERVVMNASSGLYDMETRFSVNELSLDEPVNVVTFSVTPQESAVPGVYPLTIGASDDKVTISRVADLIVESGVVKQPGSMSFNPITFGGWLIAAIGITGYIILRRAGRSKRISEKNKGTCRVEIC